MELGSGVARASDIRPLVKFVRAVDYSNQLLGQIHTNTSNLYTHIKLSHKSPTNHNQIIMLRVRSTLYQNT